LGGHGADDARVRAVVVVGLPDGLVDVRVGEMLAASVVGFVPQGRRGVLQPP